MVHEGGNIEDRSVETDSFAVEPCGCESKPHPTNRGSLYIYIYIGVLTAGTCLGRPLEDLTSRSPCGGGGTM